MYKLLSRACTHLHHTKRKQSTDVITSALPSNLVLFGAARQRIESLEQETPNETPAPGKHVPVSRKCNMKIWKHQKPMKVWLDNFMNSEPEFDKATELHPDVFGVHPRMDILHGVAEWQEKYREVDWNWSRSRAQLGRGKKKPWPQKHTGRMRQGSRTPPFWHKGGIAFGPRGPRSLYYRPSDRALIMGLTIALTVKYAQNDLIVVDNMEINQANEDAFKEVLESRNLAENTALFIYEHGNIPANLSTVVHGRRGFSIMPMVALNVWGILKHDKLVLSVDILDELEEKILWNERRYPWLGEPHNFYKDMPTNKNNIGLGFMEEHTDDGVTHTDCEVASHA